MYAKMSCWKFKIINNLSQPVMHTVQIISSDKTYKEC